MRDTENADRISRNRIADDDRNDDTKDNSVAAIPPSPLCRKSVVIGFVAAFFVISGVTLYTGFVRLDHNQSTALESEQRDADTVVSDWQERISQQFVATTSAALSLSGFAVGSLPQGHMLPHKLPNGSFNLNVSSRMYPVAPQAFDQLCATLSKNALGVRSFQIQASGVINQAWPPGSAPTGVDILNHPLHHETVVSIAEEGKSLYFVGPFELLRGSGLGATVRAPIYTSTNRSFSTWWGLAVIVIQWADFFEQLGVAKGIDAAGYDFAIYFHPNTTTTTSATVGKAVCLFNRSLTNRSLEDILASSPRTRSISLRNGEHKLFLAVSPRAPGWTLSLVAWHIVLSVFLAMTTAVVLLLIVFVLLFIGHLVGKPEGPIHAPKDPNAKISVAFIAVKQLTQLWTVYPEGMAVAVERYTALIRERVGKYRCYEAQRMGDYFIVVSKNAENLAAFSESLQKAMAKEPWEQHLRGGLSMGEGATPTRSARNADGAASSTWGDSASSHAFSSASRRDEQSAHQLNAEVRKRRAAAKFEISIGLDTGILRVDHNEQRDSYSYAGKAVDRSAEVADAARANQILLTSDFANHLPSASKYVSALEVNLHAVAKYELAVGGTRSEEGAEPRRPQATTDDGEFEHEKSTTPPKPTNNHGRSSKLQEPSGLRRTPSNLAVSEDVDSAVAATDLAHGLLTSKLITVLWLEFTGWECFARNSISKEVVTERYTSAARLIEQACNKHRGHLHSLSSGLAVITFNAYKPTIEQGHHAAATALSLCRSLRNLSGIQQVRAGIASAPSFAGACSRRQVFSSIALFEAQSLCSQSYHFLSDQTPTSVVCHHNNNDVTRMATTQWLGLATGPTRHEVSFQPRNGRTPPTQSPQDRQLTPQASSSPSASQPLRGIIQVLEVFEDDDKDDADWMYTLDRRNENPFAATNRAFAALVLHKNPRPAEELLQAPDVSSSLMQVENGTLQATPELTGLFRLKAALRVREEEVAMILRQLDDQQLLQSRTGEGVSCTVSVGPETEEGGVAEEDGHLAQHPFSMLPNSLE